jgi:flagellar basal body-associated protein FliL
MAEQTQTNPSANEKKSVTLRTLLILLAVLAIEGIAISAAFLLVGGPADVRAAGAAADEAALAERIVEELVVSDKFQNTRTGRTYLYDTEVYILIRQKNQPQVKSALVAMRAQVLSDVATIFRRAEPAHLLEPSLATLRRQIKAALDERLGRDEQGQSMIDEVLIPKCTQIRADF